MGRGRTERREMREKRGDGKREDGEEGDEERREKKRGGREERREEGENSLQCSLQNCRVR